MSVYRKCCFFINVTDLGSYGWEPWGFLTDIPGTPIPWLLSFTESGKWLSRGVMRARSTVPDLKLTLGGHSRELADTALLEPAAISERVVGFLPPVQSNLRTLWACSLSLSLPPPCSCSQEKQFCALTLWSEMPFCLVSFQIIASQSILADSVFFFFSRGKGAKNYWS